MKVTRKANSGYEVRPTAEMESALFSADWVVAKRNYRTWHPPVCYCKSQSSARKIAQALNEKERRDNE